MNPSLTCLARSLWLAALVTLAGAGAKEASLAPTKEAPSDHDPKMAWWREARFGMFIHWGLYSAPAGVWEGKPVAGLGEWLMNTARVPVDKYAAIAGRFNPAGFDAEAWVRTAKEAGMKYIVITAKHHDGFAMFRSKASAFNIVDATPFHRDPLKELADECRKQGIKLGFFYSQAQDWHHPGGATFGEHWDKAQAGDMTAYLEKVAVPQVKELLTNYGPVAVLWWDTPKDMTQERAELFLPALKLQPGIITNNRLGGNLWGDYKVAELVVPKGADATGDWETCTTMSETWGYKQADYHWKPADVMLRELIKCAGRGGNYLLNVGPDGNGVMPPQSLERLKVIGAWMKTNGEAIYGTTASPFASLPFLGTATQKPGMIYLHVHEWPRIGSLTVPLKSKVKKAYLLTKPKEELDMEATETGLTIKVPAAAPDPISSVVVLETEGKAEVLALPPVQALPIQVNEVKPAADAGGGKK